MAKREKQFEFAKVSGWGGKRQRAGRPNKSKTVSHAKRPQVDFKKPLQITLKLRPEIISLRRKELFNAFKKYARQAKRFEFHVLQFSLLNNHIHMNAEARDNKALGNGMRSLAGAFAKAVAKVSSEPGKVFLGRYHLAVITSPTQMKRSLKYVLLNQSKHTKMLEHMDPYSSARFFPNWRELMGSSWNAVLDWEIANITDKLEEAGLSPPRSWLARTGWTRAT